jgi:hypothetical protein
MESLVWENVLDQQKSGTRTGGSWFIHSRLGKTSPGYNVNYSFFIVLDLSLVENPYVKRYMRGSYP